ncbi:MAG TPA: NUDIX domain-containing protein [Actinomycetota bacterium]
MSPVRDAVVAVIRREERVLMVRRGPDAPMAGCWAPPGGRIEPGETQEEAVSREVREELGLEVRPVEKVWECPTHDGGYLLHWWLAEASAGEIRPDPAEVSEARWILPEEFDDLEPTFEAHRPFFEEILPTL